MRQNDICFLHITIVEFGFVGKKVYPTNLFDLFNLLLLNSSDQVRFLAYLNSIKVRRQHDEICRQLKFFVTVLILTFPDVMY